jgi:glyoxylase-like metal-dependent hydrolase (beta-lactamase superfamily II)
MHLLLLFVTNYLQFSTTLNQETGSTMNRELINATCILVAENVWQVRLPLPFALNHVNGYLLQDSAGWTLLDTGLNRPEVHTVWQAALAELHIEASRIRQIILTHAHPDHFGLAGYFQAVTGAPVYLSPREQAMAELVWRDNLWHSEQMADYYCAAGIPPSISHKVATQTDQLRAMTQPYPQQIRTLLPGASVEMGGRSFQALHAPGHSDGQLLFYDATDRLLLCGDQVLIKITPNIGLWPATEPDPLGRYLGSLHELSKLEVRLALPGHGRTITEWQMRIQELQAHHVLRLEQMQKAVQDGATALEVTYRVFDAAKLNVHDIRFAVAETLAHLEYLVAQGALQREEGERRVYRQ